MSKANPWESFTLQDEVGLIGPVEDGEVMIEHSDKPSPIGKVLILMVRLYQGALSPIIGRQCRFTPTCSEYFIQAVRARGAFVGGLMGLRRILRCNPLSKGGYDPVEQDAAFRENH